MTRRIFLASAAAALAAGLAGCGSGGGGAPRDNDQAEAREQIGIRNKAHEDLLALPDELRRIGLVRAIRDTGNRCRRRVEPNPVHQGEYRGMALWTARCDDNRQWAVFIAPSGDVQVRDCEQMGRLGLPACRELPPAEPVQERPRPKSKGG
jgi:hypothetical protein